MSDPSRESAYEALTKSIQIVEDLMKSLATEKELAAVFDLEQKRWPTRKDTWRDNNAKTVPRQHDQGSVGNCWAVGTYRQWYSRSVLKGVEPSGLIVKQLTMGISRLYKSEDQGLTDWNVVISYMKRNGYVKDMVVHHKPDDHADEETFEKFILHLCSAGPITVAIDNFRSYSDEDPGHRILCPTPREVARSAFEVNSVKHAALLMGRGIDIHGNEFWEIFESRGRAWGDCGFVRLAMHKGLIRYAIDMKI